METQVSHTKYRGLYYWRNVGRAIVFICLPLVVFTVFLPLKIDHKINWNWWMVFLPVFVFLLFSLLLSAVRGLSGPVPTIVRVLWILWTVSVAIFIICLIFKLEDYPPPLKPTISQIFIPMWFIAAAMFLSGLYSFILGCCSKRESVKRRYALSGTPLFIFSLVFLPFILMASFRVSTDRFDDMYVSWGVVMIPLFILDVLCLCMGFFLLLFSVGGQKDAIFTLPQLVIMQGIVPCSITFKVLLLLKLDGKLSITLFNTFIPLLIMEALFIACGLAISFKNPETKKHNKQKYSPLPQEIPVPT
eukprot:TRINITY_DN7372_c0_g1_i1.p1 TRINITY_DN7372_c0_g1~~TRINITY_DN7372_c0_g1_i1.p1  ORF type:complete len:303 (-),score=29.96 TRINITY_DN7372_c0_g1_i1:113-1021(-)